VSLPPTMLDLREPFKTIPHKVWSKKKQPKKILVIRLQALGDTIITLPYLHSLKRQNPQLEIHFLTRHEVSSIPMLTGIFEQVYVLDGGRNARKQFLYALAKIPLLMLQRYDVVIDLQNNKISRFIRKTLKPASWSSFDTQSPVSAGLRTKLTIEACGLWNVHLDKSIRINWNVNDLLLNNGWKGNSALVALNPAGAFASRNWPTENYIYFARLWLNEFPETQFVLLLLPSLKEKAEHIATALGRACINLTGKANQLDAFSILEKCAFVLSEDSGLMHMAWVQGIPTLGLFSSSRKEWSAPQGDWSACLDSSDLECGACELEKCKFGDNHCLTRYSPEHVLGVGLTLVKREAFHE
jgi:heptosyltransferase II